ncbi:MAG TPA: hypothetical protein VF546_13325 [Pyrinomonadaceae bacterium]|jgi:hypothetical protein
MLKGIWLLVFCLAFPQTAAEQPVVNRLYATTPHDASLIYTYAGRAFPEGKPVQTGAVECFVSRLKETGLFTDVAVSFRLVDEGKNVDVYIDPKWNPRWENFVVDEIVIDDAPGLDKGKLRAQLTSVGLQPGATFAQLPFSKVKAAIESVTRQANRDETDTDDANERVLLAHSYSIRMIAPERLVFEISWGQNTFCL